MEPRSITESIVEHLRIHIVSGALEPGQKLNEVQLSSHLGISRPPLREAFRVMENEQLVNSVSRKGSYVTEISLEDCQEIFEVRDMIECAAIDLLKAKGIKNLPEVASAVEKAAGLPIPVSSDPHKRFQYLKAVDDFHIKLVESAGNSRLTHFFSAIFISLARYQAMYMYKAGLMNKSQEVHEQIIYLIKGGDYVKAKKLLKSHISGFLAFMQKEMSGKQLYEKKAQVKIQAPYSIHDI